MARRISIDIPGIGHQAPIPMGCKIANIVYSSGIDGENPDTHSTPSDPAEQAQCVFQNIRRFMTVAGGGPDDIIRLTLYVTDKKLRDFFDKEWLAMFPDPQSRPARHAITSQLGRGKFFQVEIVAVLTA